MTTTSSDLPATLTTISCRPQSHHRGTSSPLREVPSAPANSSEFLRSSTREKSSIPQPLRKFTRRSSKVCGGVGIGAVRVNKEEKEACFASSDSLDPFLF